MKTEFKALRTMSIILKTIGYILLFAAGSAILLSLAKMTEIREVSIYLYIIAGVVAFTIIVVLPLLALSELIMLFIQIEYNTRVQQIIPNEKHTTAFEEWSKSNPGKTLTDFLQDNK